MATQKDNNPKGDPGGDGSNGKAGADKPRKPRRWLAITVFSLTLILGLILHRCEEDRAPSPFPPGQELGHGKIPEPQKDTAAETTLAAPKPLPPPEPKPAAPKALPTPKPVPKPINRPAKPDTAKPAAAVRGDSGQSYVYAEPWGGRHFDSVHVSLHCRENCLVLYSLEDSVHFKSYQDSFVFKRNTTIWISGIDSLNRQIQPIRIDYVIERNRGDCPKRSMPIVSNGKTVCVDQFEWPNRAGKFPTTFVKQQEAADSCAQAGKRLCTEDEWRQACEGPDKDTYPYGRKYNENHCPAKENEASRSGRFPACRSYYGLYDMTGNVWEWTSSPSPNDSDFFLVAGGNWNGGNEATCGLAKFSFYPSVRYSFVGFRCCEESKAKAANSDSTKH